jgi:hypothetical protein
MNDDQILKGDHCVSLLRKVCVLEQQPPSSMMIQFSIRRNHMPTATLSQAELATVASFPANYFLENLALRADDSALITAMNQKELWYALPAAATETVTPILLHTFEQLTWSLTEVEPDVFYLATSNVYTDHKSSLHRIDLRKWRPGEAIQPQKLLDFPKEARWLNGSCLIGPRTIVVADSVAGLIWRVDLPKDGGTPSARVWLRHESMENCPGQMKPEQPGINGVRYAAKLGYLYYTGCAKKLFMRVKINAETLDAVGEPEHVSVGRMYDDFCIDENAGVAYLTTHCENTIDCVSLNPAKNSYRFIVAGDPLNEELIGPTSAAWAGCPENMAKLPSSLPMAAPFRPCPMVCDDRPGCCAWSSRSRQWLFDRSFHRWQFVAHPEGEGIGADFAWSSPLFRLKETSSWQTYQTDSLARGAWSTRLSSARAVKRNIHLAAMLLDTFTTDLTLIARSS